MKEEQIKHLEQLSKTLRYAGLNLPLQVLSLLLDKKIVDLVNELDQRLKENPNLQISDIDVIIDAIEKSNEQSPQMVEESESNEATTIPKLDKV